PRRAARREGGCARGSSSRRWRCRCCCWSAPASRRAASRRRGARIRASTRATRRRSRWTSGRTRTTRRGGASSIASCSTRPESPRPYVYLPFFQAYLSRMVLHTRGSAPVDRLVEAARAHVTALDAELPILYARPMSGLLRGALLLFDLTAAMLFVFGAAGLAL